MEKQLIISVGREFGSGGHVIAEKLAEKFDLPLYDYNLLTKIAGIKHVSEHRLREFDEVPKKHLLSRTVRGYNNSPEQNVAQMQFNCIKKMAEAEKSFVIVGRCAEDVLKGHKALITIFILGDMEAKIDRIKKLHNLSHKDAVNMITTMDKNRKHYHNYYAKGKWGDSRNYELSVNSSKLGIDETADFIEEYIKRRIK